MLETELYEQDFVLWTEEQAAALRQRQELTCRSTGKTSPRRSRAWEDRTGAS